MAGTQTLWLYKPTSLHGLAVLSLVTLVAIFGAEVTRHHVSLVTAFCVAAMGVIAGVAREQILNKQEAQCQDR